MSDNSGSTGIVAIFAIILMVALAGFVAWRAGVFGGGEGHSGGSTEHKVDVNLH
jgi:hypothetical protein